MPLKFPNKILKLSSAAQTHQTLDLEWWDTFAAPITRSFNWGESPHRPVTSWSLTGHFLDAHRWTDDWYDEVIRRSLTSGMLLWITQRENPFSFPLDPIVWDPNERAVFYFTRASLRQDKARLSGKFVKPSIGYSNRMNLRVPHH